MIYVQKCLQNRSQNDNTWVLDFRLSQPIDLSQVVVATRSQSGDLRRVPRKHCLVSRDSIIRQSPLFFMVHMERSMKGPKPGRHWTLIAAPFGEFNGSWCDWVPPAVVVNVQAGETDIVIVSGGAKRRNFSLPHLVFISKLLHIFC